MANEEKQQIEYAVKIDQEGIHLKRTVEINEETVKALQDDITREVIRKAVEEEVNRRFEKLLEGWRKENEDNRAFMR